MDQNTLVNGLISYLGLVVLLTFHEFAHAWTAWKCGDDTARLQGRVSLNPLVHIDPIGTVLLPLLMLLVPGAGQFLVGWAKPVPVNLSNLPNPRVDDILITMAGPLMNLILAVALMALARAGIVVGSRDMAEICAQFAHLSLLLCFFNLIPIPPLDGSRVLRVLTGMSYETYYQISRFGIFILILVLQYPPVRHGIDYLANHTWLAIAKMFGLG
jgi:Zn-dependent protease